MLRIISLLKQERNSGEFLFTFRSYKKRSITNCGYTAFCFFGRGAKRRLPPLQHGYAIDEIFFEAQTVEGGVDSRKTAGV